MFGIYLKAAKYKPFTHLWHRFKGKASLMKTAPLEPGDIVVFYVREPVSKSLLGARRGCDAASLR